MSIEKEFHRELRSEVIGEGVVGVPPCVVSHHDLATKEAAHPRPNRSEFGNRLAIPSNNDLLPGFGPAKQVRQASFGIGAIDGDTRLSFVDADRHFDPTKVYRK